MASVRVLAGPNRGGKSTAGSYELVSMATGYNAIRDKKYETPNITWAVALEHQNHGRLIRRRLWEMLPKGCKYWKQEAIIVLPKPWKSEIHLKSQDAGRDRFMGESVDGIWIDEEEPGENGEENFNEMYARFRPGSENPLEIWMTFTPLHGMTWTYRKLWDAKSEVRLPGVETFRFSIIDSSKENGGFISQHEIERMKGAYDEYELEARIEGKYVTLSGRPYFDRRKIAEVMKHVETPKHYEIRFSQGRPLLSPDPSGPFRVYRPPIPGHRYIVGCDPAGGGGLDQSVSYVFDREDCSTAAVFSSKRVDPDVFALDGLAAVAILYNHALAVPEINGEHGGTVLSGLKAVYGNIYLRRSWDKFKHGVVSTLGWRTIEGTRNLIFDALNHFLRAGNWTPCAELLSEMENVVVKPDGKVEHQFGTHDDHVFAAGIALAVHRETPLAKRVPPSRLILKYSGDPDQVWMAH